MERFVPQIPSPPSDCKETVTKMAGSHQRASLIQEQAGRQAQVPLHTQVLNQQGLNAGRSPLKPQKFPQEFPQKLIELTNLAQNELRP